MFVAHHTPRDQKRQSRVTVAPRCIIPSGIHPDSGEPQMSDIANQLL